MNIVIDVGCIECGEETNIVGVFESLEKAKAIAAQLNKVLDFTGGQHYYEVFTLPEPEQIATYYKPHLEDLL